MTVQMKASWNGLEQGSVQTLTSSEEARLVTAGLAGFYDSSAARRQSSDVILSANGGLVARDDNQGGALVPAGPAVNSDIFAGGTSGWDDSKVVQEQINDLHSKYGRRGAVIKVPHKARSVLKGITVMPGISFVSDQLYAPFTEGTSECAGPMFELPDTCDTYMFTNSVSSMPGASDWVSDVVYADGHIANSLLNGRSYRRKATGLAVLDPSLDSNNWSASVYMRGSGSGSEDGLPQVYSCTGFFGINFIGSLDATKHTTNADLIRLLRAWNVQITGCGFFLSRGFGVRALDCNVLRVTNNQFTHSSMFLESMADSRIFDNDGFNGSSCAAFIWISGSAGSGHKNIVRGNLSGNNQSNGYVTHPKREFAPNLVVTAVDTTTGEITLGEYSQFAGLGLGHLWSDGVPLCWTVDRLWDTAGGEPPKSGTIPGGFYESYTYYGKVTGYNKLKLCRRRSDLEGAKITTASGKAQLRGCRLPDLTLAQAKAVTGGLSVVIDGVTRAAANLDLSAAASFSDVAAAIGVALGLSGGETCTYDSTYGQFVITSGSTGSSSSITVCTGAAANDFGLGSSKFVIPTNTGSGTFYLNCGKQAAVYVNDGAQGISFESGRIDQAYGASLMFDGATGNTVNAILIQEGSMGNYIGDVSQYPYVYEAPIQQPAVQLINGATGNKIHGTIEGTKVGAYGLPGRESRQKWGVFIDSSSEDSSWVASDANIYNHNSATSSAGAADFYDDRYNPNRLYLGALKFTPLSGTTLPALQTAGNRTPAYRHSASINSDVMAEVFIPHGWKHLDMYVWWTNASGGLTGNVVWKADLTGATFGESLAATTTSTAEAASAAAADAVLVRTALSQITWTGKTGKACWISVRRVGAAVGGADSLAGNVRFVGLEIIRRF